MSTYLSYRRRFSEPEKPEPRFQWRLRVQSLMMGDDENSPALSERRAQRYDSRRDSRDASEFKADDNAIDILTEDCEDEDVSDSYRYRRERFKRTKSEGQFRFRMRFSKYSETSKSLDDADSRVDSETECRRVRFSDQTDSDLTGNDEAYVKNLGNNTQSASEDTCSKAVGLEEAGTHKASGEDEALVGSAHVSDDLETVGGDANFPGNQESDENPKDVSKGAIPKRPSNSLGRCFPSDDKSKLSENNNFHSSHVGMVEGTVETESEFLSGMNDQSNCQLHTDIQNVTNLSPTPTLGTECQTVDCPPCQMADDLQATSLDSEPCQSNAAPADADVGAVKEDMQEESGDVRKVSFGEKDQIEDIEAIIERIIAEEEAMMAGKDNSPPTSNSPSELLCQSEMSALKGELKELQNSIDDCSQVEMENGIGIALPTAQNKHRASSLPSYQIDTGDNIIKTVVPYSSSCPSARIASNEKDEDEEDEEEDEYGWAYLPLILLEDVFTLLSPKERHQASQVCRQWYDLFYSPRVWETFILLERTLTKKRFNLYKGYQRELCPGKTQLCFRRVGSFFKRIVVTPITDYFNLYEFLRILAAFLQYQEDHGLAAMPLLHTFDFTFACASRGDGEILIHGTGGQILEMIKQLLLRMSNLKHLKLNQLLIDIMEVPGLFDAITNCFGESLNSLEMLNVTKVPLALTELAQFRSLIKLTISPQHLNEEVLLLIGGLNLRQLYLLQDPYTCECEPVATEAWKLLREMAPWLHVYLEVSGTTRAQLLIQPRAPVHGVFLRTPYSRLTNDLVMSLVEYYSKTLRYFVQERLPRVHGPGGFHNRCDSSLLFLVRRCSSLHTLVVRERISTSTLILLASEGKNVSTLLVRRHGLIKRCDWPRCGDWTKEFYSRLRHTALDYDRCTDEVCTLLRRRWRPMTDKQFMRLKIVPRIKMF